MAIINKLICWLSGHKEGLITYESIPNGRMDYAVHKCMRCDRVYRVELIPRGAALERPGDWNEMWDKPFNWEQFNNGR